MREARGFIFPGCRVISTPFNDHISVLTLANRSAIITGWCGVAGDKNPSSLMADGGSGGHYVDSGSFCQPRNEYFLCIDFRFYSFNCNTIDRSLKGLSCTST